MRYIVYDIKDNEYTVEANVVKVTDDTFEFYESGFLIAIFRKDMVIGFCKYTE